MLKLAATILAVTAGLALAPRADAWTISQNFDSSAVGASCGWDAGTGSTVSATNSYSPKNSCQLTVQGGQTAYGAWGGVIDHPSNVTQGQALWLRIRTFWPNGTTYNSTGEGDHLKFMRFHTMSASNSNIGYDDIYINPAGQNPPFMFIYEGEQIWDNIGSTTASLVAPLMGGSKEPIQFGVWETYEYYVKFDTVSKDKGGQAEIRFWKNGSLMADMTDRITLLSSDAYSDRTHLFTYWNGGAPQTEAMYVDDVQLQTDTPSARDAAGNPFIGVGTVTSSSGSTGTGTTSVTPDPPSSVSVQ
jgi:hypothetical protein